MDGFFTWFFALITTMFGGVWNSIVSFFRGIFLIFDFKTYIGLFAMHRHSFGVIGWILAVLCFILVYAFWFGVVFLIVMLVRKYVRFRQSIVGNEDMLEEIAELHRDVVRLTREKEKILKMKAIGSPDAFEGYAMPALPGEATEVGGLMPPPSSAPAEPRKNSESAALSDTADKRFYRLAAVDEKYETFVEPIYDSNLSLSDLCDDIRNYACSKARLFYEVKTIRLMIAGLASTKLILLQGISGTGKTSLPYIMGKYFRNDATIASVQPSWRDRSELFGFYNEFTKKFNETEVLRRIYESGYNDDINVIILDEMNIARVEYYFAEMLSILEMPDPEEWKIQLVSAVWDSDPARLTDGKLQIPQNVWYIGTANNDDSTFAISDKVYDRALVINLDSKGVPFEAPETEAKSIRYSHVESLYRQAQEDYPVTQETLDKIEKLNNYIIDKFRVAFGNRILKQLTVFVPVYVACGGDEIEAIDYIFATKVFRKFEALNLSLIRDEIKGLIAQLDALFGRDTMTESIAFLRRLQKSY
ncbi:MAG: hypothetical protein KBS76_05455 [Ruminococcus sp.]|nr:hypothetical protein [Candidatus Apopatosoma intestinale]